MDNLLFKSNYRSIEELSLSDLGRSIGTIKMHKAKNPSYSFFARASLGTIKTRNDYIDSPYDLYEISRIIDTEAYVSRSFGKKNNLVFKEGYTLQSRNMKNLEYVKKRIAEIEYISKIPFRKLLKEISFSLIAFSNAYIVKVRKKDSSSGKVRKYRNSKTVDPVAAYFPVAPESVQIKPDDSGEAKKYRQFLSGNRYREFPASNFMHLFTNKRSGFIMGTPSLTPVKDDILALRRIEESVESLIYKTLFPIIHIKVGNEKVPAKMLPNGTSEVDTAVGLLEHIEDEGGLVTSERISVDVVGAESRALRVESYLAHFKQRVFSGLGMSGMDFGEGGSAGKATGDVLSGDLLNSVLEFQSELEEIVTRDIFDELLLESGSYQHPYEIIDDDKVRLVFNNIDIDRQIKKESHVLNLANSGGLTVEELREEIGREPLQESDFKELLSVKLAQVTSDIQTEAAIKIAKAAPKPALGSFSAGGAGKTNKSGSKSTVKTKSGNTKSKNTKQAGASNSAKSKTSPSNQYSSALESDIADALSIDDLHRLNLKIDRVLRREIVEKITYGLIDYKEFEDDDLDKFISNVLNDIDDKVDMFDMNPSLAKMVVKKTIDKTTEYINNIQKGNGLL